MNVVRQVIEPMYECKPDIEINELIAKRLGLDWGRHGMSDMDVMKIQWSKTKLPDAYKQINPNMKLPTFEEMLEEANLQLPTPPEKSVIESAKYAPGELRTDTGKINFYSPSLLLAAACRTVFPCTVRAPCRRLRRHTGRQEGGFWSHLHVAVHDTAYAQSFSFVVRQHDHDHGRFPARRNDASQGCRGQMN